MKPNFASFRKLWSATGLQFVLWMVLSFLGASAHATTYNLPDDIGSGPFSSCSFTSGTTYSCTNDVEIGSNDTVNFSQAMTLAITGNDNDFKIDNNGTINGNGYAVTISAADDIDVGNSFAASINFVAGDDFKAGNSATITGNITAADDIELGNNTNVVGNVYAGDELSVGGGTITGNCTYTSTNYICSGGTPPTVIADYRFDECSWTSGTAGAVIDSSGSGYHGTPYSVTTATGGVVQRAADLSASGTTDYIKWPVALLNGRSDFTTSLWFKTSTSQAQQEILQGLGASTGDDEIEIYLIDTTQIRVNLFDAGNTYTAASSFVDGGWHHLAVTRAGTNVCVFLDATSLGCNTRGSGALSITNANALLTGQEQDAFGGSFADNQSLRAQLDEFKLFGSALSSTQIASIRTNELAGNNWDGTARTASCQVMSIADSSIAEGNSGTTNLIFNVTLNAAGGAASSATYTLANGTATGGSSCSGSTDFVNTGGTVTIAAGATSGTISVPVCGDATYEGDETFTVTLSSPVNATLGTSTATGTILEDDLNCYTDSFTGADDSAPSSDWTRTNSSGSFGMPRIYSNRLRLTDASGNVATAAHLQKMFPGAGNKIIVEFDYFAYNGTGADGIALTFSDASVSPNAGAYGGSLGYAQRSSVDGFAGGWLGIGIDEYGNFQNDNEGRGDGGSPTGLVADSVSVRGSGSGNTGYLLHAASIGLSPGIDQPGSSAGPGHRYRITIDHSDSAHAYVTVERNTGSGYTTIIAQYDAKAQSGQAAVPTNWLLSYTGSTGASTNIHEIDNLSVCAIQPILSMGPDHYVISHSGAGLTCEAEPVTFTAHDAAHARAATSGKTLSISTSTNSGTWAAAADGCTQICYNSAGTAATCTGTFTATTGNNGQASYLFGTGETGVRLCLKHNATGTVNINVTDGSTTEASGAAAGEASPGADSGLVFSNTGFRFYADGSVDTLGNLVAGLRSDTVNATWQPTPQAITIRALKSSETTPPRCVSLLGSTAKTIQFAYQCTDPTACHASSGGLEINGTAVAGSAAVPTPASNVSVTFDGSGTGSINLKYWDVGQIKLYAQASIADAVTGSSAAIVTGASNAFVVKPYGFTVKACTGATTPCTTANNAASDGTGSVFAKAGDPFNATVTAVAYGGTVVTPSFGLGTGNGTETVLLAQSLVAPSGGSAGALGGTTAITRSSFTDGVASVTDLTWSEAGVMTLAATNSSFQTIGTAASGTSGNIGRFTPHHFGVTGTVVPRSDLFAKTTGTAAASSTSLSVASAAGIAPGRLIVVIGAGINGGDLSTTVEAVVDTTVTLATMTSTAVSGATVYASDAFTYMGEPMKLSLLVTTYNKAEGATQNYRGGFAKLDAATLGSANLANWICTSGSQCMGLAAVSGTDLTARLAIDTTATNSANPSNTAWSGGSSTFTLYTTFNRAAAPDGPYAMLKFGAKPLDSDGITLPPKAATDTSHCVNLDVTTGAENAACTFTAAETQLRRKLFQTDLRFGRLWLGNAYGSGQRDLTVPFEVQYWNGSAFVKNTADSLTGITSANIGLKQNGLTSTVSSVGLFTVTNGAASFVIAKPTGTVLSGSVDIAVALGSDTTTNTAWTPIVVVPTAGANMTWLRGRWYGAAYDRDPTARATFGIYGGKKGPIYIRENY